MNSSRNHPISCGLATTASFARAFSKRTVSARSFDIAATQVSRVPAGFFTAVTKDKDGGTEGTPLKKYERYTSTSFVSDFAVNAAYRQDGYFQPVSFSSSSTGTLGNPVNGLAAYVADGPCTLLATSRDGETSAVLVTAEGGESNTTDIPDGWVSGTLAAHCTDQIASLAASGNELNVFTVANGSTFVRNPGFWASSVDFSCASPWNSTGGAQRAGTLVSPRHVVFCEHASFYPANGATMYFVSAQGEVVTRTLESTVFAASDIRVGVLDSDVPASISFARVLPTDWASASLPGIDATFAVPVIVFNQQERSGVSNLTGFATDRFNTRYPDSYADYYQNIVKGDSCNPVFLVIDNAPVLIGVLTFGGSGAGFHIAHYTTQVNAAMTTLGGGYSLTTVDLSEFPTY